MPYSNQIRGIRRSILRRFAIFGPHESALVIERLPSTPKTDLYGSGSEHMRNMTSLSDKDLPCEQLVAPDRNRISLSHAACFLDQHDLYPRRVFCYHVSFRGTPQAARHRSSRSRPVTANMFFPRKARQAARPHPARGAAGELGRLPAPKTT